MRIWTGRRKGGLGKTLMELMVASSLLLLLAASCAQALRSGLDYYRRVQEQTDMERQLMVLADSLQKELAESSASSLEWQEDPPALTFLTPRNPAGSLLVDHLNGNRLRFQTVLSYRVEGTDFEMRRYISVLEQPVDYAVVPSSLTPARDAAFFAAPGRERRTLAKGVVKFDLEGVRVEQWDASESVTSDLKSVSFVRIQLELERTFRRKYAVRIPLEIAPRN